MPSTPFVNNDDKVLINNDGNVGIGTSTPAWLLNPFSTTASQLALSAGAGINQWAFRNAGGDFFLSTTTVAGTATTSTSALTILGSSGNVGIGDTDPDALLDVKGAVCLDLNADEACTDNTAAISDARLKTNVIDITNGLELIEQLRPVRFTWNGEYNTGNANSLGFLAQEVEEVFPELVITDTAGYKNLDYSKLTAVLATAVQELDINLNTIASTTATTTPKSESFATSFFANIFSRIGAWLADATNGLTNVVANVFNAKEKICVDGECLTKDDIRALLELANAEGADSGGAGGDSGTGTSGQQTGSGESLEEESETPPEDPEEELDTSEPVITIIGDNPNTIPVDSTYIDPGATVTDTNADGSINDNLGIDFNVNGVDVADIYLDTSTTTTYTIIYSSQDGAGNTGTATRVVNIQ